MYFTITVGRKKMLMVCPCENHFNKSEKVVSSGFGRVSTQRSIPDHQWLYPVKTVTRVDVSFHKACLKF